MIKICPKCNKEWPEDFVACPMDQTMLITKDQLPNGLNFNIGDANAISGGIHVDNSKVVDSHDVHYYNVVERKSEKEITQERYNEYYNAVVDAKKNGIINNASRTLLNTLRFKLGLSEAEARNIEDSASKDITLASTSPEISTLSRLYLDNTKNAVDENNDCVFDYLHQLEAAFKSTHNEKICFYYSMIQSAKNAQTLIDIYKNRDYDSYWLTFWCSVCYFLKGNTQDGLFLVEKLTSSWKEKPDTNVLIILCVAELVKHNGIISKCKGIINEIIHKSANNPSSELIQFYNAILSSVGLVENNYKQNFYKDYFFTSENDANRYYEEALTIEDPDKRLKKLEKAARGGSVSAQNELSDYYSDCEDMETAIFWAEKAAANGSQEALCNLGSHLYLTKSDIFKGLEYLRKAASNGFAQAQYLLGYIYTNDNSLHKEEEGIKLLKCAIDNNDSDAYGCLGDYYIRGYLVDKNIEKGLELLNMAVSLDNDEAQYVLGEMYLIGEIIKQDYEKAIDLLQKASDQENSSAQKLLGDCYKKGYGVPKDVLSALKYYNKSAENGNPTAQYIVGKYYENGEIVEKDPQIAFEWYLKAADQGDESAQFQVGHMQMNGIGTAKDVISGTKWVCKSADANFSKAQRYLGQLHENGIGVDKNIHEALKWYQKAAQNGSSYAEHLIAELYFHGKISNNPDNISDALKYYQMAFSHGFQESKNMIPKCVRLIDEKIYKNANVIWKNIKGCIKNDKLQFQCQFTIDGMKDIPCDIVLEFKFDRNNCWVDINPSNLPEIYKYAPKQHTLCMSKHLKPPYASCLWDNLVLEIPCEILASAYNVDLDNMMIDKYLRFKVYASIVYKGYDFVNKKSININLSVRKKIFRKVNYELSHFYSEDISATNTNPFKVENSVNHNNAESKQKSSPISLYNNPLSEALQKIMHDKRLSSGDVQRIIHIDLDINEAANKFNIPWDKIFKPNTEYYISNALISLVNNQVIRNSLRVKHLITALKKIGI